MIGLRERDIVMRRTVLALVASAALVLAPAAAAVSAPDAPPSPGSAGIGDDYFPLDGNGGYDVAHYGISVSYKPSTHSLRAVSSVRATRDRSRCRASTSTSSG